MLKAQFKTPNQDAQTMALYVSDEEERNDILPTPQSTESVYLPPATAFKIKEEMVEAHLKKKQTPTEGKGKGVY